MKKPGFLTGFAVLFGFLCGAGAELVDNGDGTVTQIRNDGSALMWVKDANLSVTLGDHPWGNMDWNQAVAWIDTLNAKDGGGYAGYSDWRLPKSLPDEDDPDDMMSPSYEMTYMYYVELGNKGSYNSDDQSEWGLRNPGIFQNLQSEHYWASQEVTAYMARAFSCATGERFVENKIRWFYVWPCRDTLPPAIRPGDVNGDRKITLEDALIAVHVSCGLGVGSEVITLEGDANGDGQIGMEEAVYILQIVSDTR